MESIELHAAIKNRQSLNLATPNIAEKESKKPAKITPLECYIKARDFGHDPKLEKLILQSDNSFASYMYALNICGANIWAHIQHIAKDKQMIKSEKKIILDELLKLASKTKEKDNG